MTSRPTYIAETVPGPEGPADIRIHINGKTWHMWGRNAEQRETALADNVPPNTLPVLLGAGMGHGLTHLAKRGPVAVVDREAEIDKLTGLYDRYANVRDVLWLNQDDPAEVFTALTRWQAEKDGKPLVPATFPLYLRLDRDYYGTLADTVNAHGTVDFWSQARYPKFQSTTPRVLFFDAKYFLCDEIRTALDSLGVEYRVITLDKEATGTNEFIEELLKTVIDFKPDFALTVNHFGLDREGKLAGLLEELSLPLASWFVDNPHLILHEYAHPGTDNTALFTFDAGNLDILRAKGFTHVHYLPLATDPSRFKPGLDSQAPRDWTCDVSFVGNSMTTAVADNLAKTSLPAALRNEYQTVAAEFGASGETDVIHFLERHRSDWHAALMALPTPENRLALESLLTWEATRQYRLGCVKQTLDFAPIIVGDQGWSKQLGPAKGWRHLERLDYYADLPRFYPLSKINFNCTSRQMIGAVNQRVFDVPACGGFVLTDHREQMGNLFDLESETVVYRRPEEIPDLIRRYLTDKNGRKKIITAARKRILAEHTYAVRIKVLLTVMRQTFSA